MVTISGASSAKYAGFCTSNSFFTLVSFLMRISSFNALDFESVCQAAATPTTLRDFVYFAASLLLKRCAWYLFSKSLVIPVYRELSLHLNIYTVYINHLLEAIEQNKEVMNYTSAENKQMPYKVHIFDSFHFIENNTKGIKKSADK